MSNAPISKSKFAFFLLSLFAAFHALAMSWTSKVASTGQAVLAQSHWPSGVLELLNDPLRADGWNPGFSEWPNDVSHYEFKILESGDIQPLIKKFTAIRSKVQIRLRPEKEARGLGFTTVLKEGNGTAIVFSIGN